MSFLPTNLNRLLLIHSLPLMICTFFLDDSRAHMLFSGVAIIGIEFIIRSLAHMLKKDIVQKFYRINWLRMLVVVMIILKMFETFTISQKNMKISKKDQRSPNSNETGESERYDSQRKVFKHYSREFYDDKESDSSSDSSFKSLEKNKYRTNGVYLIDDPTQNYLFLKLFYNLFIIITDLFIRISPKMTIFIYSLIIYFTYLKLNESTFSYRPQSVSFLFSLECLMKILRWFVPITEENFQNNLFFFILLLILSIFSIRSSPVYTKSLFLKSIYEGLSDIYDNDYTSISKEYKTAVLYQHFIDKNFVAKQKNIKTNNNKNLRTNIKWSKTFYLGMIIRPWCFHFPFLLTLPYNLIFLTLPFLRILFEMFSNRKIHNLLRIKEDNNQMYNSWIIFNIFLLSLLILFITDRFEILICAMGLFLEFALPILCNMIIIDRSGVNDLYHHKFLIQYFSDNTLGYSLGARFIFYGLTYGIVKEKWIEQLLMKVK